MRSILGLDIDPDSIPVQVDGVHTFRTIAEAPSVNRVDGLKVEIVDG